MKYWVFDLDGTLVDSFCPYFENLEELLGTKLSAPEKKEFIGLHPAQILIEKLGVDRAKIAIDVLAEKSKNDASRIPVFESVPALIQTLIENGKRLSVFTSRDLNSASLILQHLNLAQYFDHVISGDCVSDRKPAPEGLVKIQNLFNCQPHEMVMVGDHDHDMLAGRSAGVFTVRASWHRHWNDGLCPVSDEQFFCHKEFHDWAVGRCPRQ